MSVALDALKRLHGFYLAQAAEVGASIAVLERAAAQPVATTFPDVAAMADAVVTQAEPERTVPRFEDGDEWTELKVLRSDATITMAALPDGSIQSLMPSTIGALNVGAYYESHGFTFGLIGGKICARKADDPAA
jgi:hypothetical protein